VLIVLLDNLGVDSKKITLSLINIGLKHIFFQKIWIFHENAYICKGLPNIINQNRQR